MKEQLIRYVDLLFAGAPDTGDIKQEILQNTLDRYDDLIAQGKTPEAAYSLSISGIGDVSEILRGTGAAPAEHAAPVPITPSENANTKDKRTKRAAAIAMYILCPVPLFVLGNVGSGVIGLCLMFVMIAAATALIILSGGKEESQNAEVPQNDEAPKSGLHHAVDSIIWVLGLGVYFLLSFATNAWYITWLIFPMIGTLQGIASGCLDLVQRKGSTSNGVVRIVLLSLATLMLVAILLAGMGIGKWVFQIGSSGSFVNGSGSAHADEVTDIAIEWAAGDILIEACDTDTITFTESGYTDDDQQMVYTLQDGSLSISYCQPTFKIGFSSVPEKDLMIRVPRNWVCKHLEIDCASTDTEVWNLTIDKVELNSAPNNFLFAQCSIGAMDVDGASNRIELIGVVDTIDCDGLSTSIKAFLETAPTAIDLDGMSSTLDLTLREDSGFRVDMDGLSNDFHSDFATTLRDGNYIYGDGLFHIVVDGLSSSVYIRSSEKDCTHIWHDGTCLVCRSAK